MKKVMVIVLGIFFLNSFAMDFNQTAGIEAVRHVALTRIASTRQNNSDLDRKVIRNNAYDWSGKPIFPDYAGEYGAIGYKSECDQELQFPIDDLE